MGLPAIKGYELPAAHEIPRSRLSWVADGSRIALLIHDMQNYFVDSFPRDTAPISPVIQNISRLRNQFRRIGAPVFFTAQPGRQFPGDRGLQADFWGPGMSSDPGQKDIAPDLTPGSDDIVLVKWRYSAFQRSNLEELLRARGRDQLVVTGVFAHIGCTLTSAEAFMRDIQPFFVADAVADFSRAKHDMAVAYVAGCCGIAAMTDDLLQGLA